MKCLFVDCVVFNLSGTPINPPHSLVVRFFLIATFDKCFFLARFPYFPRAKLFNDTLSFISYNVPTFTCWFIPQHVIPI